MHICLPLAVAVLRATVGQLAPIEMTVGVIVRHRDEQAEVTASIKTELGLKKSC